MVLQEKQSLVANLIFFLIFLKLSLAGGHLEFIWAKGVMKSILFGRKVLRRETKIIRAKGVTEGN